KTYGINKRHANGVISSAKGAVDGAKECRISHIKTLEGKAKSCEAWLKKAERKLKLARKFYAKKNWQNSKSGCGFPLSSDLKYRQTNWQKLRFQIHNKKRKLTRYRQILSVLKSIPVRVRVPNNQALIVGSKDESYGNQVCQWNGDNLRVRVPVCLESKFGKNVDSQIGNFPRNINRLPATGAKTWHFYYKDDKWCVAVSFTASEVERVSRSVDYGCIGIDMNPGSIGWAYIDTVGNLRSQGQIPLQTGLPNGKQQAQIVKACLELSALAIKFQCPVVCEELDFSTKKEQLRERGKKYARMLSGWAYSEFFKLLNYILSNRGIELITVNPAYSSVIGLVKYLRMYGLASEVAAALVIGRRGMRLSEKIPGSLTAFVEVNSTKHVWSLWHQLNKKIKQSGIITNRHSYYSNSNWDFLGNLDIEEA
ncbi:IS200/IS605 family accessory protein TnpB-related protein, partial [Kamptonema sp. UHCC 0994]|uniref:IS200/IS605 family accessory protein TnpB-related protein n=1 Tax=Kamptonema sp. UHCC 0994 TaxID=3031329 RepID=UPI0023BAABEF